MGIFDVPARAARSREHFAQAEQLATTRHLREAVAKTEEALAGWVAEPSFLELAMRKFCLGDFLTQATSHLATWRASLKQADAWAAAATRLAQQALNDPLQLDRLQEASRLYGKALELLHEPPLEKALAQCREELTRRRKLQELLTAGDHQAQQKYFKKALAAYQQALKLCGMGFPELTKRIDQCTRMATAESTYETALQVAQQHVAAGYYQRAVGYLEAALAVLEWADGQGLLDKARKGAKGKEQWIAGLRAEQAGHLKQAAECYQTATGLLPDGNKSRLRWSIVVIKGGRADLAAQPLQGMDGEQAAYLRGYVAARQGNLQLALREWRTISSAQLGPSLQVLQALAERDRLARRQAIEQRVTAGDLGGARQLSEGFIADYGADPVVQANLDHHILPRLAAQHWQGEDCEATYQACLAEWSAQPGRAPLHNWAVAAYYRALTNPATMPDLLTAWPAALANLREDPGIQAPPWLAGQAVPWEELYKGLLDLLQGTIDGRKDADLEEYLRLRDLYRPEIEALKRIGARSASGPRLGELFVTPACHALSPNGGMPTAGDRESLIFAALYTPWNEALAACLDGDPERAFRLRPGTKPGTEAERHAHQVVAYHEACYYLTRKEWRRAMPALQIAAPAVKARADWGEEIDRLGQAQRQHLDGVTQHLEFAQQWHSILGSRAAASYLSEVKTQDVRRRIGDDTLSLDRAQAELQDLLKLAPDNAIARDTLAMVELDLELKQIFGLFDGGYHQEAIRKAKQSRHDRVRFIVAETILQIILKAAERRNMHWEDMQQLGYMARELCPREPAFQEMYRSLKLY